MLVALVAAMILGGCAATQQETQLSPEEQARIQDSIAKANERELKIARMFAYDKLKQNQWEEARKYLWKVVDLDVKHEYNDWARLYQAYMNTNQADSAQVILGMGIKYHPEDPFLTSTLGFMLKTQNNLDSALVLYQKAAEVDTENVEYRRKIAEIFEQMNRPEEALAAYEALLAIAPEDQEAKDKKAYLVRKFRDPEEYIALLEGEVKNNPEDVEKRMELLFAYSDQSSNEKVVEQANRIIELDDTRLQAYRSKAVAYENLGDYAKAIGAYDELLKANPDANDVRLRIADNYRLLGNWTKAREWLLNARKAAGGDLPEADYILGQTYEAASDKCSADRGLEYDDKLVLGIAYGLYKKAANSTDFVIQEKANRRISYFETNKFIPQYSDWFMSQDKEMPARDCYGWIKAEWPEVNFLTQYLDELSKSK
jgi:tetratricopeptide (TPR) repeat protein